MRCKFPLVLVKWRDSATHGEQWSYKRDLEDDHFEPGIHYSVGWLIKVHNGAYTLAPNLGYLGDEHNECYSCLFTIPHECVISETVLRAAQKEVARGV